MSDLLVTTPAEGVFRLSLEDSQNGNHLTEELCADLMDALARLAVDPALKVLVLTGGREVFSAGASLSTLTRGSGGATMIRKLGLPERLVGFPVPVIAALEGDAIGGGLMLAVCCDMLVAAENRRFGLNFTTLGFSPGMGATRLVPALVGHGVAMEMLLSGKFYKGRELVGRGLFNAVVPQEQVLDVALDQAMRIAERPRYVIEMVKAALAEPRLRILADALEREHALHQLCFARPEIAATIEDSY